MPDPSSRRRTKDERRRYTARRAERTATSADKHGARWTIDDARVALDLSLSVPDAALQIGRTAAAVEVLRAKWRRGQLPAGLAQQVPPPPRIAPSDRKQS